MTPYLDSSKFLFLIIVLLFYLGLAFAFHLLYAFGPYRMAKHAGIPHAWLGLFPIGTSWLVGLLAERSLYSYTGRRLRLALWTPALWGIGTCGAFLTLGLALADVDFSGLVVAADGEQVSVAWYDTAAGQYCMSPTAAGVDRLTQACSLWNESNAVFAFQDADFAALCADEPVLLRAGAETKYSVLPPAFAEAGELSRELLAGFGLNPYLARVYAEAAGDRVYVENYNALGYNALRMSAKGELTYTAGAAGQGISLGLSEEETGDWSLLVEGVRALLSNLNAQAGASGTYSLSEIVQEQNGELTLLFDLTLGGYAVVAERPAAHAVVQNGQVVYLRMSPVRCEASETQSILPARQAVAALRGGHDLRLNVRYMEKENGVLTPVLCSAEE